MHKTTVRPILFLILVTAAAVGIMFGRGRAAGSGFQPAPLITQPIDDNHLVTLAGNTRREALSTNDRGAVADDLRMDHMFLVLKRSPAQEQALEQYIAELHDSGSPNYHHWLNAQELSARFGWAATDIAQITGWLRSHGFTVGEVYPNGAIDFSGTAGQVRGAFHTEIHNLNVNGASHIANMSDPQIPAALAPAVAGVVSLNNFRPHTDAVVRLGYSPAGAVGLYATGTGGQTVVPADLATIYNFNPLFQTGYSGQGQTIVVIEASDLYNTSDWNTFRATFGLDTAYPQGAITQVHPAPGSGGNCSDPGVNGNDAEAAIDTEWATAAAPSATIEVATCADTATTFGGFIALQNLLSDSANPPAIVSISYGESEANLGASGNAYINSLYQQADSEGVSVFVAAGDEGAASSDANSSYASHGVTVSGFASTPYNVSVGGTDFGDTYTGTESTYWSSANSADYSSALSYIPEIPWNDSCAGQLLAGYLGYSASYGSSGFCNSGSGSSFLNDTAAGGGPSGCATGTPSTAGVVSGSCAGYAKPAWQAVLGNPGDGVRDIPDVSMFAANGLWGHSYVVCYSDIARGGASCSGAPNTWSGFGGTSISSPVMAAIQAIANQRSAGSQGNPDATYYSLAAAEYGSAGNPVCNSSLGNTASPSCIFYDITLGDIDVDCQGSSDCYLPSGTYGALSTTPGSFSPAYQAGIGWDFATGIGTVNAYNLVMAFPTATPTAAPTATPTAAPTAQPTPTATATHRPRRTPRPRSTWTPRSWPNKTGGSQVGPTPGPTATARPSSHRYGF